MKTTDKPPFHTLLYGLSVVVVVLASFGYFAQSEAAKGQIPQGTYIEERARV